MPPPPLEPPRPPRELLPRELELRERLELPRDDDPLLRDDFAAPPLLERLDAAPDDDLRAPDERVEPLPADLARDDEADDFLPLAEVAPPELRDDPLLERLAVERDPDDLRAPLERELVVPELDDPELLPPDSGVHLPDMTRCAASATASAMSEPSLVALETTLLAARSAVSAASRPASRIFLRAAGLALIAAAAAARPAASISLLIAAFASLSTVV